MTSERRPNRLAGETSPYLLQHAHNPVDWYPWGEEALARARAEDRPIFLSIGYAACHWCHVMERESFENEAIAALMNQRFVNIKVDREERPDLDDIYMAATQLLAGQGGWPNSVVRPSRQLVTGSILNRAFGDLAGRFDNAAGGFGAAPKFPHSMDLSFLLRYHRRTGN